MDSQSNDTEQVVRRHLQAFLEQQGVEAIVRDYAEDATLLSEAHAYRGRPAIGGFFADFIASLPPEAVRDFTLRSLHVDADVAYITWSAGSQLPLGTDTFVVRNGRIVSQTVAMHRASQD